MQKDLAMLQAGPHVGVTSQYAVLWKLHKESHEVLDQVMYMIRTCVAGMPVEIL